ncbi:hypothetical protein COH20_003523 [Aspergillus flavus]|uniref:DUF7729 domain-containing protein n=1 Tax=Aspergillus oryzae (strain 3.042) TaxID=1160506 RepID=I8TJC5_ASPO3|nr:hypothetical protein Ao3042_09867 [Aspergillus oryzae 3.042]KAJ1714804.1 hypothetical protein NYO67_2952 [Aspergillus flavus]KDE81582.1 hypothetical protein AO1008_08223 [Aspergillus oryzae 100-8]RAQ71206.1 hypothetical protein COH20_003523 [Aspergillus flavus]RAQ73202.1 hypothetical protein COH21_009910 [Aspergillus flavus]|eukprot:EIT74160.1 hypothetical protein Ao3042_09867 [Aspergillus oryzae 3.042]
MKFRLNAIVRASESRTMQISNMRPRRRTQLPSLCQLLLTVIAVPSVVASVIPSAVRTDLDSTNALDLPLSGEIVSDDLQDVSDSPLKERAAWDPVQLDSSPEEADATHSPILLALEENSQTSEDNDNNSQPALSQRSTSSSSSSSETPTPFDTNLSTNFTSDSCPKFFKNFLSDTKFTNCYAISMLLRDSSSFFQTLKSAPATSHLLDLSCAADVDQCSSFMTDLASRITKSDACGKDYDLGNPVVTDAYTDMIIYEPMYRASCLKNPSTGDYCFVDAATNSSNPSDYDVYFIPYGSAITNAPYPTCNKCVQASMDVFGEWAQKSGQPLAHSYLPSARSINSKCGVSFANANITVAGDGESSAATWSGRRPDGFLMVWVVALSVGVSLWGWV